MYKSKFSIFLYFSFVLSFTLNSCQLFNVVSGANIDEERFALHREAKIKEIRKQKGNEVLKRIKDNDIYENADISMVLSTDMINDFVKCYNGTKGFLNYTTSYTIDSTKVQLVNGCAIATIYLKAYEKEHNVNVNMVMDALITLKKVGDFLESDIEPFNITPVVDKGVLVLSSDAIANLIRINTADMNKNMPPMKIPLTIKNEFKMDKVDFVTKDNINFKMFSAERNLSYNLRSNEPLILNDKIIVNLFVENLKLN